MGELVQFVVFLIVIMISFGVFRQSLWYPDDDFDWAQVREIFHKPYLMLYGEVYATESWRELL